MNKRAPYNLFVDDERDPSFLLLLQTRGTRDIISDVPWVTVRRQQEAQEIIRARGLPAPLSFDHDPLTTTTARPKPATATT